MSEVMAYLSGASCGAFLTAFGFSLVAVRANAKKAQK